MYGARTAFNNALQYVFSSTWSPNISTNTLRLGNIINLRDLDRLWYCAKLYCYQIVVNHIHISMVTICWSVLDILQHIIIMDETIISVIYTTLWNVPLQLLHVSMGTSWWVELALVGYWHTVITNQDCQMWVSSDITGNNRFRHTNTDDTDQPRYNDRWKQ